MSRAKVVPASYEAWYHTRRGSWIGGREFALLRRFIPSAPGATLLDVGCGTGYFSRRFAGLGYVVTGVDPDAAALRFAVRQGGDIVYLQAGADALPFPDQAFDHCLAITSLCFMPEPLAALGEMLRVSRGGVTLGLLNRHSLLYYRKQGRGGYRGARWDSVRTLSQWLAALDKPLWMEWRTAIFLPGGGAPARLLERLLPNRCACGAFLAVNLVPASRL